MHKEKMGFSSCPDNLCVARLVGKAEIDRTPAAKALVQKEWDRLRSKAVWDAQHPREWDEVRSEAQGWGVYSAHRLPIWHMC